MYKSLVRSLFFLLDPENAHNVSSGFLRAIEPLLPLFAHNFRYSSPRLQNKICELSFPGPVGMAAGFDKNATLYPSLSQLGFDFIECGTFTTQKQDGNPQPRLFRLPKYKALINHMGFNNPGAELAAIHLSKQKHKTIRGINIGKSKSTPIDEVTQDYVECLQILAPFADYITINISSPNTSSLRKLQEKEELLQKLLFSIQKELEGMEKKLPLFVKLAPDLSYKELDNILDTLLMVKADGVILTNTSLDKSQIQSSLQKEKGGLSGKPIQAKSTQLIRYCFTQVGEKLRIIGVGGIDSGKSALEKIAAGASLIQIYTGYIYEGPFLPSAINRYIDKFLKKEGLTINEVIGSQIPIT